MKKLMLFTGMLAACISLFAGTPNTLYVKVKKVSSTEGKVSVTLFDTEQNWLKKGQTVQVDASDPEVVVKFDNVPSGVYAVSVMHDKNSNGKLDTMMFGIPTEAYGFSNNAKGHFGPASFEDSAFSIQAHTTIEINLN